MKPTPKDVILSLKTGDLLVIPFRHPTFDNVPLVFSSVLRTGEGGEIYLSIITDGMVPIPHAPGNPFRWDDQAGALVDRRGEIPEWYSDGIRVEPGGARKVAEEYARVPRMEQLRFNTSIEDLRPFVQDPRFSLLYGIVRNGEVRNLKDQLLLMLDIVGVECTHEQFIGVHWVFELLTREVLQHRDQFLPRLEAAMAGASKDAFVMPLSSGAKQ